jgi:hypothetical protein
VAVQLREDDDSPPERLLQAVWQHQRLLRDQLKTLEGQPVRVLHPGFRSVEGGPDFRGAVVQIGNEPPRTGDVEVDLRSNGWHAHGHDRNPAFRGVILHVIWESERACEGAPTVMKLRGSLDAPLGELSLWLASDAAESFPDEMRGRCCAPLRGLSSEQLILVLRQAAQVRLQSKAEQFRSRARHAGWEQALWEGLFRALGYKHNVWPMQRLAELRPRWSSQPARQSGGQSERQSADPLLLQARLFGISGLLPADLTRSRSGADGYLRRVWDQWWRERDEFSDCVLPRALWRLHGSRPANHPQRRLALAASWAVKDELATRLEEWCGKSVPQSGMTDSLLEALQVEREEFWSWHLTFYSPRLKKTQPLLGAARLTDLAVNVVLPWLWTRAAEGKSRAVQTAVEERFFSWPPAEDNALLKLARQRLLGGASARALKSAAAQQGLIQIVRDFCEHSNALCENCKFPDLVKEFLTA